MRILGVIVLTCAFPFIALSQIQPDKAIIEDYAHPRFARMIETAGDTTIVQDVPGIYLAAGDAASFRQHNPLAFIVLRQLSPQHAIIQLNSAVISSPGYRMFRYLVPAGNAWKRSPALLSRIKQKKHPNRLLIYVSNHEHFLQSFGKRIVVLRQSVHQHALLVELKDPSVLDELLNWEQLVFADIGDRMAKEELSVSGFDLGVNAINTAHHYFPGITGEGLMVSVKENRFDSNDTDLKGRVVNSGIAAAATSGHATIMATMIAGAGNSFYDGKGAAPKAGLQSASFANLMPEPAPFYSTQGITVQNHSYGTGIENFYGTDAAAYDALVADNPVLMHVFSAGNSGTQASAGPYAGLTGVANLTGSFKMAKNILVIGAIDSVGNVEPPSSRGPAYDGRIKPELVAFGQDGSSGAAAIVSGISLLMQHAYRQLHNDSVPPAALVKTILINTADEVGPAGPDFISGYGNANAYRAISSIRQSHYFQENIHNGNVQTFQLNIGPGISSLKLTLGWTDPAAQANANKALVNDLDMELAHVPSGQTWHPWILSSFPHKDSLQLPAVRGRDTLNNLEQITLQNPLPGNYAITIKGNRVTTAGQQYFIAWHTDTANTFQWMYPMTADPVIGGTAVMTRWHSNFAAGATGTLQYNIANGGAWQTIASNVDLSKKYIRWNAPDTFSAALLRMIVGGNNYATDTFVISKLINTQVGFNCPDSFLFYWNKPGGVSSFRVYQRGSKFLEPVTVTTDSFYIAAKNANSPRQFTIAPIVGAREGIKAYTFDYATQGVDCYFRTFLAQVDGSQVRLQLQLGSIYRVAKILLQRSPTNAFTTIQMIDSPAGLAFDFTDAFPTQGINNYRIALQLQDGRLIYSNIEVVYFLDTHAYLVYPNPASISGGFKILQQEPLPIRVQMHDATGRLVKDEPHQDLLVAISTFNLKKGLYFITVIKDDKAVFRAKVVIGR